VPSSWTRISRTKRSVPIVAAISAQQLDGEAPVVLQVDGRKHASAATRPDLGIELVPTGERRAHFVDRRLAVREEDPFMIRFSSGIGSRGRVHLAALVA
jgi:hypothetical protein